MARANALKTADQDLASRLLRFAKTRYGVGWLDEVLSDYVGDENRDLSEHETALAIPWSLSLRHDSVGQTVASAWEAENAGRVTGDQRIALGAYAGSRLSPGEVTALCTFP